MASEMLREVSALLLPTLLCCLWHSIGLKLWVVFGSRSWLVLLLPLLLTLVACKASVWIWVALCLAVREGMLGC